MQLVEAGALDPSADVNRYLDFQIPATYPQPITLTHLATHTAGFEDDGRDVWTTDARHVQPIGAWIAQHVPDRVRASRCPGVVFESWRRDRWLHHRAHLWSGVV